ncbi:MAG TPA: glucose 1-dehydrogenase [Abditibacteriaceae bacterium]|jgi:3-oxoacyl-[acyl-carrier protein] reductase
MIESENSQQPLQDKTALVTGASRGIGRAIALRLAQDGAYVVVQFHQNEAAAREVVENIINFGGKADLLGADLSNLEDVRRLWHEFDERFQNLDVLVNNAGGATFDALESVSEADFDAIFSLNVRGLFFNTQEAARRLRDGGRVINISSGITRVNAAGGSVYAASKAAVEAFTRCWAAELGPRQITVNTVSPGMTQTDLLASVASPEALDEMIAQTPLGRLGQPTDIADVVAFLCSDQARWITANNLLANGGVG